MRVCTNNYTLKKGKSQPPSCTKKYTKYLYQFWYICQFTFCTLFGTIITVRRVKPNDKKSAAPVVGHRNGRKEGSMRFYKGLWWYKGQSYPTLHDALVSVWPKPSKKAS